jgi:hypothetical protein
VIQARNYEKHFLGVGVINRCRERDKLEETIEHVIARCSSLSESAYLGRHNKMAKIIRQQIAVKCKPFDRNIPPYRVADKSLARPGRKQATATEDFDFRISYS